MNIINYAVLSGCFAVGMVCLAASFAAQETPDVDSDLYAERLRAMEDQLGSYPRSPR